MTAPELAVNEPAPAPAAPAAPAPAPAAPAVEVHEGPGEVLPVEVRQLRPKRSVALTVGLILAAAATVALVYSITRERADGAQA
jgi:hypothetical protein